MTGSTAAGAGVRRDGPILALAVAAVFASAILAISEHAENVEQGYRLAAARREGEVLLREAMHAERQVSILSIPTSVTQRATAMHLGLEHPRDRRILTPGEVTALLAPAPADGAAAVAGADARPAGSGASATERAGDVRADVHADVPVDAGAAARPRARGPVQAKPPLAKPSEGMSK